MARGALSFALAVALLHAASALDNGVRLPPMGWSSWYGFTRNINETMLRGMADGMVNSGLHAAGYEHIWIDDGWALPRDPITHAPGVDRNLFPSGMRNLSDYVHARGLKFGIYTSKGKYTCLGSQPSQPKRPGSCGFEEVDANVYAHEWQVDQVKDDGCGGCPQDKGTPFTAMRDALNKTGRSIVYAIHSDGQPWLPTSDSNGSVANMWRTGDDLFASSYDMWLNRLDLATDERMPRYVGPGAFANPDFLEVGYTPRQPVGGNVQSIVERRSMFTMWAALPAPLILSADLRPGAASGGIDSKEIMSILTNTDVIAVNQDALALPMLPIRRSGGLEVWRKPLVKGAFAVILFNRNATGLAGAAVTGARAAGAQLGRREEPPSGPSGPSRSPVASAAEGAGGVAVAVAPRTIAVNWAELGLPVGAKYAVRDLWAKADLGVHAGTFAQAVAYHVASIYTFTPQQ